MLNENDKKECFWPKNSVYVILRTHFMSVVEGWRGLTSRCRVKETRKTEVAQRKNERYWGSTASTASFFNLLNPRSQPPNFIILQNIFVDKVDLIKRIWTNLAAQKKWGWKYQKKCYDGEGMFDRLRLILIVSKQNI